MIKEEGQLKATHHQQQHELEHEKEEHAFCFVAFTELGSILAQSRGWCSDTHIHFYYVEDQHTHYWNHNSWSTILTSPLEARPTSKAAACPSRILQWTALPLIQAATAGEQFKRETRPVIHLHDQSGNLLQQLGHSKQWHDFHDNFFFLEHKIGMFFSLWVHQWYVNSMDDRKDSIVLVLQQETT